MGAPSKDLWIMLIICVPIILWQASFLPEAGSILEFVVVFESLVVVSGAYLVWKYGGLREAVTKVLEVTRMWDVDPAAMQPAPQTAKTINFCRYCGSKIPGDCSFCQVCGATLRKVLE